MADFCSIIKLMTGIYIVFMIILIAIGAIAGYFSTPGREIFRDQKTTADYISDGALELFMLMSIGVYNFIPMMFLVSAACIISSSSASD